MVRMTETLSAPETLDQPRSTSSTVAVFAAMLGWSLFFVVPALFIAALSQGIEGGPDDNSGSIIVIMMVLAGISFVSAVVGTICGGTKTRVACLVLLCCQAYPLFARNGFLF